MSSNVQWWNGAIMVFFTTSFTALGFWVQGKVLHSYGDILEVRQPPAAWAPRHADGCVCNVQKQHQFKRDITRIRDEEIRQINEGHVQENIRGRRPERE